MQCPVQPRVHETLSRGAMLFVWLICVSNLQITGGRVTTVYAIARTETPCGDRIDYHRRRLGWEHCSVQQSSSTTPVWYTGFPRIVAEVKLLCDNLIW
eukprot:COSAG02_NODE_24183_length_695_cov_1.600671_1_plen_97_part_10